MKIACRYGELILKSQSVRRAFTTKLVRNIQDAISDLDGPTHIQLNQAFLTVEARDERLMDRLSRIFGIASLASLESSPLESLQDLLIRGDQFFSSAVQGRRFVVRCRRVGQHSFRSVDVEKELGAKLHGKGRVDLHDPEVTCWVEVRDQEVSFSLDNRRGPGGFPIGTQGRALCLISGGLDSPVAAWHSLRRGLRIDYLFCCLGGPIQLWGPKAASKWLADHWSFGYQPKLFLLDFTSILDAFESIDHSFRNIILKRFFYKAADRVADLTRAQAIITGEAIGQVSSQTLSNLITISKIARHFIIRPLIAMDKIEIMAKAHEIGTYSISEKVPEFCNVSVQKPRVSSYPSQVEKIEAALPPSLMDHVMKSLERLDLRSMHDVKEPESFEIGQTPPHGLFVWISTPDDRKTPPNHADMIIGAAEIRKKMLLLPKSRPIVLDCAKGTMSRDASAYLRENGFEAYHLQHVKQ